MLYDAFGRPLPRMRRAIGFLLEYRPADESGDGELDLDAIGSHDIELDEPFTALEEC